MRSLLSFLLLTLFYCSLQSQSPSQLPPLSVEITGNVAPGHILLSPFPLHDSTGMINCLYILDSAGSPLVYIPNPGKTGSYGNFMLQQNGSFSCSKNYTPTQLEFYIIDHQFNVTDTVKCGNGYRTGTHEMLVKKNGNYLVKCLRDTVMDLSSLLTSSGATGDPAGTVTEEIIQELDPSGNVIWEWKALDHYDLNDTYSFYFNDPAYLDNTHFNSFDIANDGHYIISHRHLNEVSKINAVTGEIMWRLGGKNNLFTLTGDTVFFSGQHDARLLENGQLSVFDNSLFSPAMARGVLFELDTIAMSATIVSQFPTPFSLSSRFVGNFQQLPGDHWFINWGGLFPLEQTISVTELDASGNEVMRLDLPDDFITYRARKYELPFKIERPDIDCEEGIRLVADSGYAAYYWSTGDSGQSIIPEDTGYYHVWCQSGLGYIRSFDYYIDDLQNICKFDGIASTRFDPSPKLYPNPASDRLYLHFQAPSDELLRIYNANGKQVKEMAMRPSSQVLEINLEGLPGGIYFIVADQWRKKFVKYR